MKRGLHIVIRRAAEGLSVDITASPSLWAEVVANDGDWVFDVNDIELRLTLPVAKPPIEHATIEVANVSFRPGGEDWPERPPDLVWDDTGRGLVPPEAFT